MSKPDPREIHVYAATRRTKNCDECGVFISIYSLVHPAPGASGRMVFTGTPLPQRTLASEKGNISVFLASDTHWVTCTKPGRFRARDRAAEQKRGLPKPPPVIQPCLRCGLKVTGKLQRAQFPTPHDEFVADNHTCIPKE